MDVSESNFGSVFKSFAAWSGSVSGLEPNKTYYARGNAKMMLVEDIQQLNHLLHHL